MKPDRIVKSQAQEKRTAKLVGGTRQPASGAFHAAPNDVKSPMDITNTSRFLVENKRTDGTKSITLQASALQKLNLNALMKGLIPLLGFEVNGKDWYALPDWALEEIING